jgi:4'-phosphopantetheinyl transferase
MVEIVTARNHVKFSTEQLNLLRRFVPKEIGDKANKFVRWQDGQACLIGKYILAKGLMNFGFDRHALERLKYTAYGRPYLVPGIDFNISHSEGYVVCAISDKLRVGIDVEQIRTVTIEDFADQFSRRELTAIMQASNRPVEFFRRWTIKEAISKADGRGLSIPLNEIETSDHICIGDESWYIHNIHLDPTYMVHLAVNNLFHQNSISVKEIEIGEDLTEQNLRLENPFQN